MILPGRLQDPLMQLAEEIGTTQSDDGWLLFAEYNTTTTVVQ